MLRAALKAYKVNWLLDECNPHPELVTEGAFRIDIGEFIRHSQPGALKSWEALDLHARHSVAIVMKMALIEAVNAKYKP